MREANLFSCLLSRSLQGDCLMRKPEWLAVISHERREHAQRIFTTEDTEITELQTESRRVLP